MQNRVFLACLLVLAVGSGVSCSKEGDAKQGTTSENGALATEAVLPINCWDSTHNSETKRRQDDTHPEPPQSAESKAAVKRVAAISMAHADAFQACAAQSKSTTGMMWAWEQSESGPRVDLRTSAVPASDCLKETLASMEDEIAEEPLLIRIGCGIGVQAVAQP